MASEPRREVEPRRFLQSPWTLPQPSPLPGSRVFPRSVCAVQVGNTRLAWGEVERSEGEGESTIRRGRNPSPAPPARPLPKGEVNLRHKRKGNCYEPVDV